MTTTTKTSDPAARNAVVLRSDYRPLDWRVAELDLHFDLYEDHALVRARARYERVATDLADLRLDGEALELVRIALDGKAVPLEAARRDERSLTLDAEILAAHAADPGRFELEVVTRLVPQDNTSMEGLYRSGPTFCTQMEAEGFRRVTYYPDRPDALTVWTTTITADAERYPVLLSNGNLIATEALDQGRHLARWHDPHPKPCYLFALVAGDLGHIEDRFTTASGRDVTLRVYTDKGNEERARHALRSLQRAMRWDEQAYGREYDLDTFMIVAVDDFNLGAMENKGLNLFNSAVVLADAATATDEDFLRIEGIVAHEYFHNWSGNRVTCRDWFQLSLKEGFTVFRDQTFSADLNDPALQRIQDARMLRDLQFPEDAGPQAHPIRPDAYITIDNFYTRTIYEKGAEVIRMMHVLLGAERFRAGADLYFERHDGQAVTCEDFVAAMEDASGVDLAPLRRWYAQAGTPHLDVTGRHDPADGSYELTVAQTTAPTPGQPTKQPLHIPLKLGLLGPDGHDLSLTLQDEAATTPDAGATTRVLDVREARQTFRFTGITAPPVPSLLRGFSAPVVLDDHLGDDDLAFLARHDSDAFNRCEAAQRLALRELERLADEAAAGAAPSLGATLATTFGSLLARALDEPAAAGLVAEMVTLPGEAALCEHAARPDPDAIHAAHDFVARALAEQHRDVLTALYDRYHGRDLESLDPVSVGVRRLKNTALGYLAALDDDAAVARVVAQLEGAGCMTDEQAALELVAEMPDPARSEALQAFKQRWRHEPLVMNKWFAAQASARVESVPDDILRLVTDETFDANNPNKMRSVWRNLGENPFVFHRRDGRCHRLFADMLAEVDSRNPILAARLVGAFNSWRRFDAERQASMEAQLRRLLDRPGLSENLFEMVSKALA